MILLVDIGNSALKWALLEGVELRPSARSPIDGSLDGVLARAWGGLSSPRQVLVADVTAGAGADAVNAWAKAQWGCDARRVFAEAEAFGVKNAYREPARLGVDRWLALLAARPLDREPVMVVDCGTAVTVDVLDGEGQHLGGLIVPGLSLSRRCLERHTQVRTDEDVAGEIALLARDTAAAVRGGALYALVAFVDRVAADVAHALGRPVRCILTGGDAGMLLPLLRSGCAHRPDLVLEGLAIIAQGEACAS